MRWLALLLALGLAAAHQFIGRLHFLAVILRSRWLSFAGGAAVADVFVHLLPELAAAERSVEAAGLLGLEQAERHVYLVALNGLARFYGSERAMGVARARRAEDDADGAPSPGVFW